MARAFETDRPAEPQVVLGMGLRLAAALMLAIMWIFRRRNQHRVNRGFRLAQTVSAAAMAFAPLTPPTAPCWSLVVLRRT